MPLTDTAPMRRAVAFCQSIKMSEAVTQVFPGIVDQYRESNPDDDDTLGCTVWHVDGTQNALKRNQALEWLRDEPGENECRILSNVRCLSEGVDVPALDAVLFPQPAQLPGGRRAGRGTRHAQGRGQGVRLRDPACLRQT